MPPLAPQIAQVMADIIQRRLPQIQANAARGELAKTQTPVAVPYTQYVDGREGAPLESVRAGGVIVFRLNRVENVVDWIYEQLVQRSPIGKNDPPHIHYFQDHQLYVDGARVAPGTTAAPIRIPPGAIATIVNRKPYARRIEHGWSLQAPDGVYEVTAVAAQRRFPSSRITFSYTQDGEAGALVAHSALRHHNRPLGRASYAYPTITIQ